MRTSSSSTPAARRGTPRLVRVLAALGAGLMVAGIFSAGPGATPALAAGEDTDSAITVKWVEDDSRAAQFQPARNPESIHYGDFEDVTVSVSQTAGLVDQVVRVTVTGMPGATGGALNDGVFTAYNYVQAMQCWGDPLDPRFYETCQWGGHAASRSSVTNSPQGNIYRNEQVNRLLVADVPFRNAYGDTLSAKPETLGARPAYTRDFDGATSNEVTEARVTSQGTSAFTFAAQSAESAPHLGCGDERTTGERCWLVVVPRGEHTAPHGDNCVTNAYVNQSEARGKMQFGSPVNPACGYWDNRVVVPLDFQPLGGACPPGSAERRTTGSPLMQAAMSSWQPALCQRAGGAAYSYSSLTDATGREQVATGQVGFAFTGAPVRAAELADRVDPAEVERAELVYAPAAVTAPVIGFYALSRADGRVEGLKLTPRLVAKLITQSYKTLVPWNLGDDHGLRAHVRGPEKFWEDPEFQAINPDARWAEAGANNGAPGLVMQLNGSDAVAQLWRWIQADWDARTFLAGAPDEHGMRINPYYLPKGHPDAHVPILVEEEYTGGVNLVPRADGAHRAVGLAHEDGTPLCLCDEPMDAFLWADETQAPGRLARSQNQTRRYESVQYNPPVNSFADAAANIQKLNKNQKIEWDATAMLANGEQGDFKSAGSDPSQGILMGVTDGAYLERYDLSAAALQVPNRRGVFVEPTAQSMAAALAAQAPTEVPGITRTDFARLPDDGYPLTMVAYGVANLTASDAAARADYADLIEYAATTGQQPGREPGQLPPGYAPLSDDLRAQALEAVAEIRAYTGPAEDDPAGDGDTQPGGGAGDPAPAANPAEGAGAATTDADAPEGGAGETTTEVSGPGAEVEVEATSTPGSAATPLGLAALGGTLLLGAGGAAFGPLLLRRRGAS